MRFSWDEEKDRTNRRKHKISFSEAILIFNGTEEIEFDQENSSSTEDRFRAYGRIPNHGLVLVVFVELIEDELRIISARRV